MVNFTSMWFVVWLAISEVFFSLFGLVSWLVCLFLQSHSEIYKKEMLCLVKR